MTTDDAFSPGNRAHLDPSSDADHVVHPTDESVQTCFRSVLSHISRFFLTPATQPHFDDDPVLVGDNVPSEHREHLITHSVCLGHSPGVCQLFIPGLQSGAHLDSPVRNRQKAWKSRFRGTGFRRSRTFIVYRICDTLLQHGWVHRSKQRLCEDDGRLFDRLLWNVAPAIPFKPGSRRQVQHVVG